MAADGDQQPRCANDIGTLYMDGKGVPQNTTEALRWIARSAANGSSSGQNNLGGLYRDGKDVQRDFGKAFAFFAASAAQGNAGGQFDLGLVYAMGQGTRIDNLRAFMWFDIASNQVSKGRGLPRPDSRAYDTGGFQRCPFHGTALPPVEPQGLQLTAISPERRARPEEIPAALLFG